MTAILFAILILLALLCLLLIGLMTCVRDLAEMVRFIVHGSERPE